MEKPIVKVARTADLRALEVISAVVARAGISLSDDLSPAEQRDYVAGSISGMVHLPCTILSNGQIQVETEAYLFQGGPFSFQLARARYILATLGYLLEDPALVRK